MNRLDKLGHHANRTKIIPLVRGPWPRWNEIWPILPHEDFTWTNLTDHHFGTCESPRNRNLIILEKCLVCLVRNRFQPRKYAYYARTTRPGLNYLARIDQKKNLLDRSILICSLHRLLLDSVFHNQYGKLANTCPILGTRINYPVFEDQTGSKINRWLPRILPTGGYKVHQSGEQYLQIWMVKRWMILDFILELGALVTHDWRACHYGLFVISASLLT